VATVLRDKHLRVDVRLRPRLWRRTMFPAILASWAFFSASSAKAQITQAIAAQPDTPSTVHGRVLNRATHEPVGRALVFSPDQRYATLTDDEGRFEFKFPPRVSEPNEDLAAMTDPDALRNAYRARQIRMLQNARPDTFLARKPGFLQNGSKPSSARVAANQSELIIYLDPESLIVGHVNLPGSEGDMRIRTDLYRREIREGQEHWDLARTFTTWADGEFRFSELTAGTYKLGTAEQLDRDPLSFVPGGQLFGFAPIFYPGATDFSVAGPIQLGVGATFQANLSPVRHPYYRVKIAIRNASADQSISLRIYPLGHPGPGYSLGYNSAEQLIQGTMPDGNYTVEADARGGQSASTGFLNFSVRGGPSEGSALTLIPNTSLTATVKEEFNSRQAESAVINMAPLEGASTFARQRRVDVQVTLTPIGEFGSGEAAVSQPIENSQDNALVIPNVRPGRYRVHVVTGIGFAASIVSGGTDLLRQPLIVGLGGSSSPIEITLRDDGAEVDGKAEEGTECHVYFLPVTDGSGQFREANTTQEGSFSLAQLPPGTYRVLAFDSPQNDLAYADAEAMRKLESKGQVVHVDAGQKEHLRLKIIQGGDSQ
jgi:hypothetical protein